MPTEQILKAVLEQEAEGEDAIRDELAKAGLSDKASDAMLGIVRLMSAFRDELSTDVLKKAPKMAGYANDDAHDYAEGGGKGGFPGKKARKATKKGKPASMPEPDGDEDGDDDDGDDDGDEDKKFPPSKKKKTKTMKADDLPPEVREHFETIVKASVEKAERLERELEVERDARLTKEYIAKAEKEYRGLGSAQEVGPILKALHQQGGDTAKAVEKLLKTAAERANNAALFSERGRDGSMRGDGGSTRADLEVWNRIEKAADGLIQKSSTSMTKAQAIDLVLRQQPELYEEYRQAKNEFRVGV